MGVCSSKHVHTPPSEHKQQHAANEAAAEAANSHQTVSGTAQQQSSSDIDGNGQLAAGTALGAEPRTPRTGAAAEEYPATPITPETLPVDASPSPKYHKYNSMEKPHRSAMRSSLDTPKSDTYSRRSSSGCSNVGFSVSGIGESPEAEHHRSSRVAGADSISLKKIVDIFYEKVVADPKIGRFFKGIDMVKLKRHQVRTMALAFGGKELVNDEDPNMDLRKIHLHLISDQGLDLSDWECFVGLFDETLEQLGKEIPAETRQKAMRSLRATRHYFVPIGQETEYTSAPLIEVPEVAGAEEGLEL